MKEEEKNETLKADNQKDTEQWIDDLLKRIEVKVSELEKNEKIKIQDNE